MNFNNFSCLIFVLKCAKKHPRVQNVVIPPYCILLVDAKEINKNNKIKTLFKKKMVLIRFHIELLNSQQILLISIILT